VAEVLQGGKVQWSKLRAIAAAQGPGLLGSLLIGYTFGRALAAAYNLPFLGVHHLEAHVASLELGEKAVVYPLLVLVVTGGHTHLFYVRHPLDMELLGRTQDDAVGEAFDKVAASLGLPYPGGPHVEALAREGYPQAVPLPKPHTEKSWDFSFSGLKTAFFYARQRLPEASVADLCASWQHAVFTYLLNKLLEAAQAYAIPRIGVVGGVAANAYFRSMLTEEARKAKLDLYLAPLNYCMDNAAMVAVAGWHRYINGLYTPLATSPFARG
jgi:N6-L-threonylcarbamoyladenine synthase